MTYVHDQTRTRLRKLARQGRLIDEAFKYYQRTVYPGAPADQVHELRTTFFAGAAELIAVMTAISDDTSADDISAEEEAVTFAVFTEVETFHSRTVDLAMGRTEGNA